VFNLCAWYFWQSVAQPLSKSSLVYLFVLLVWSPPPHIPYISSPNQCLLFATHAHTIAACFAVVPQLNHLFLASTQRQLTDNKSFVTFHYLRFNSCFPDEHGLAAFPWFSSRACSADKWHRFFTSQMPFLSPKQQRQSTERNTNHSSNQSPDLKQPFFTYYWTLEGR